MTRDAEMKRNLARAKAGDESAKLWILGELRPMLDKAVNDWSLDWRVTDDDRRQAATLGVLTAIEAAPIEGASYKGFEQYARLRARESVRRCHTGKSNGYRTGKALLSEAQPFSATLTVPDEKSQEARQESRCIVRQASATLTPRQQYCLAQWIVVGRTKTEVINSLGMERNAGYKMIDGALADLAKAVG